MVTIISKQKQLILIKTRLWAVPHFLRDSSTHEEGDTWMEERRWETKHLAQVFDPSQPTDFGV